jgi:dissimilatory sulfite reductase related protein
MAKKEIIGKTIEVDDDGYIADRSQWSEDVANALAVEVEIVELTDDHWKVIRFLQKETGDDGSVPTLRKIGKHSGVDMKGLYKLFPNGPVKKAAYIAGLPKPKSCV